MTIRHATPIDYAAITRLTHAAFETMELPGRTYTDEHYLSHIMRKSAAYLPDLEFVGEINGEIVASILYTKSKIVRPSGAIDETITFGPVSVVPALHGQGLGAAIIRHSLDCARGLGYGAVVIVGHPTYYPRFGFKTAASFGLTMPDGGAFDAFMALELADGTLGAEGGVWHEDSVFSIDQTAFEAWHKDFIALDAYIAAQPEALQPILQAVLDTLRRTLPLATEKISWQMPTFCRKRNLIHFAAQKSHLGLYPGAAAMEHFAPRLNAYKTSKGAIQFPYKTFGAAQLSLIAEIAAWCGENNAL